MPSRAEIAARDGFGKTFVLCGDAVAILSDAQLAAPPADFVFNASDCCQWHILCFDFFVN
jgi:hypothetical protein